MAANFELQLVLEIRSYGYLSLGAECKLGFRVRVRGARERERLGFLSFYVVSCLLPIGREFSLK